MTELVLIPVADGVRLSIFAKPSAKTTEIRGVRDGALEIAIAAAPRDGAANEALVRFVADVFGLRARDVVLLAGTTGRRKRVELHGTNVDTVRGVLASLERFEDPFASKGGH